MDRWQPVRLVRPGVLAGALCVLGALDPAAAQPVTSSPASESARLRKEALAAAFNLDHDEGLALLRKAVVVAPDDPAAHRALATALWLEMLFRRGGLTVDHYLGSLSKSTVDLQKPDPALDAEFRTHLDRALTLSQAGVERRPRDPQAHYDLGGALGLQASYVATVEGKMLSGFKAARRSFDEHERVLELDPSRTDAGLIVGTYRYLVSTLSLPMRMMAYVAGFGGGRDRAVEYLKRTAAGTTDARTDAMFALILVYNREQRWDEALQILRELKTSYPRNRLVVLEAGSTALRAGRHQQADELLTEGMGMLERDKRRRMGGEEALWHYKRGAARAALGRTGPATTDLQTALASPDARLWVKGRSRLELGRLALARADRAAAAAEARQAEALCRQGNDPICVEDAHRLLKKSDGR